MLTIACRDVGQPCDCVLSGETEKELLKKAAGYAVNIMTFNSRPKSIERRYIRNSYCKIFQS